MSKYFCAVKNTIKRLSESGNERGEAILLDTGIIRSYSEAL